MVLVNEEADPGLVSCGLRGDGLEVLGRQRTHAAQLRSVQVIPGAQALEALTLLARDRAIGARTHVEQESPAARDHVHQVTDGGRATEVLVLALGPVVAEGQADASAVLPRLAARLGVAHVLVFAGQIIRVDAAVAVVRHALGARRVEVLEERPQAVGAEVLTLVRPVDVIPDDVGLIAVDQVTHVHEAVARVVGVLRATQVLAVILGEDRTRGPVVPVQTTRVVQAHSQTLVARGIREAGHEVSARTSAHGVARSRLGGIPQGHAVVVLGRQHRVAGAGTVEESHPLSWIPRVGVPRVQERIVRGGPV